MNGRAPNFSWTGSQSDEVRKRKTRMWSNAGAATRPSSRRIRPATTRIVPPRMVRPQPQARSPMWANRPGVGPARAEAMSVDGRKRDRLALHEQPLDGLLDAGHDGLRQGRVVERDGHGLTRVHRPPEELHHRVPLGLVLRV